MLFIESYLQKRSRRGKFIGMMKRMTNFFEYAKIASNFRNAVSTVSKEKTITGDLSSKFFGGSDKILNFLFQT